MGDKQFDQYSAARNPNGEIPAAQRIMIACVCGSSTWEWVSCTAVYTDRLDRSRIGFSAALHREWTVRCIACRNPLPMKKVDAEPSIPIESGS